MKRLLFVDHVTRILGGGEINLVELLSAETFEDDWSTACACSAKSRLGQALKAGNVQQLDYGFDAALDTLRVVGRRFSLKNYLAGLLSLRAAAKRLEEIIAGFGPDIVVTCTNKDGFCARSACRARGVPCVWWVNDIISPDFFPWPARKAFSWQARHGVARLVVVSEFARQALLQQGLPAHQITTIHNGIPLARYQRQVGTPRGRFQIPPDQPVIGIVGRFTPWKGQDFFLRLAQVWSQQSPQGHFVLIGHAFNEDQVYETFLRQFVREQGLSERVHFEPFQSNIAAVLSELDVLIHASVRPEPFGRVIIEAMALAVPVIAARAGGVPEIVTDGADGLLAEPGNLENYRALLQQMLTKKDWARNLGEAGQRTVQQRFTLERVRREFDQLFTEII